MHRSLFEETTSASAAVGPGRAELQALHDLGHDPRPEEPEHERLERPT